MSTLLSSLGGPASVTVDVDKGIPGIPGTQFYLASGNPNDPASLPGVVPKRYDFATNIDPSDSEYLFLYQYNYFIDPATGLPQIDPSTGGLLLAWIPGLRLIPNSVSKNESAFFVNGQSLITFEIELPPGYSSGPGGVPSSFDVQFEITNPAGGPEQAPVAATYQVTNVSIEENIATVSMGFGGVEYVGGFWIPITGSKIVQLLITVV